MPTFDFTPQPVQMPNAVGNNMSSAPIQIREQARQNLSGAVDSLGASYQGMLKEQDDADMVATRSAVLRIKAQEDAELSSVANPADVKKIQESYKKQYDSIISGKEPLNGKPYFRNQSGKDKFNKGFMENFHTQRYVQGTQQTAELHKRDTKAKLINGIKSRIDQPNWNTQSAHDEIDEYVTKYIEASALTPEEGKAFRDVTHTDLDIERANKMFAGIEMLNYDGENDGKLLQGEIDRYKESVSNLDYLDQDEKNAYTKKADALFKRQKAVADVTEREAKADKKLAELDINGKVALGIADGSIKLGDAIKMDGISDEYKISLYNQFNKQTAESKKLEMEKQKSEFYQGTKMDIERAVYNYDPADDRLNGYEQRNALQLSILEHPTMSAPEKANYQKILMEGLPLDDASKMELKGMEEALTNELGIGVKLDKAGSLSKLQKARGFEKETKEVEGKYYGTNTVDTGDVIKDGLNSVKRMKIYTVKMGEVRELFKRGKIDEARVAYKETITALQKHDDDIAYYDSMSESFVTRGRKNGQ